MSNSFFTNDDFHVFQIDGLDERMDALRTTIRPKLEELGNHFAPTLSILTGNEMFAHVAKHARRTINPPKDTWVAFASNKRGYKMLPHFQIGLWESHIFIWFAVIYEAPNKSEFGKVLEDHVNILYEETPQNYVWSTDHTKPESIEHRSLSKEDLKNLFIRLQTVKKAEILCGLHITKEDAVKMKSEEFLSTIEAVFQKLIPLYKLSYK